MDVTVAGLISNGIRGGGILGSAVATRGDARTVVTVFCTSVR